MTTFDMLEILPAEWQAELARHEIVPVTTGMSGADVYRVRRGGEADHYLKIARGIDADHLRGEAERMRWLAAVDVRVPHLIAECEGDGCFAVTMTALVGVPAEQAILDDWPPVVTAVGRAFRALHALPVRHCPFDETLEVRLARAHGHIEAGAIDGAGFDARNRGLAPLALYRRLVATAPAHEDRVVVHGDATLSNLMVGTDRAIGFIDCGNCGRGDRYIDLALLVAAIAGRFGAEAQNAFLRAYGVSRWDAAKAAFYLDLYELF